MPTLTIRNVPEDVVDRLKESAGRKQRSMEQEVRQLLTERYPDRNERLSAIRERWDRFPSPSAEQVDAWVEKGRQ